MQNGNSLVQQIGVILLHIGELGQRIYILSGVVPIDDVAIVVQSDGVGVLAGGLGDIGQGRSGLLQGHILLAYGLVVLVQNVGVMVSIVTPYNSRSIDGVVDQLCSVLTRARTREGSIYVLQQAVLISQSISLGSPASTYQASLLSVVAEGYEQHLSSFLSGYLNVRCKNSSGLTSDDAQGLAVLDVTAAPVGADVGKGGVIVVVRRSVRVAGTQNIDHLCHLRTGYGLVGTERAIIIALNYAQLNQSVHNFGLNLNVSRIRERCTSKHGECASKRQYQCKNLFEIHAGVAITRKTRVKFQKIHPICNISKKRFLQMGYILWIQPVRQSQSQTSIYII